MIGVTPFVNLDGVLHRDGAVHDQLIEPACIQGLAGVLPEFPSDGLVMSRSWREVHPLQDPRDMVPELEIRIVAAPPGRVDRIYSANQNPGRLS